MFITFPQSIGRGLSLSLRGGRERDVPSRARYPRRRPRLKARVLGGGGGGGGVVGGLVVVHPATGFSDYAGGCDEFSTPRCLAFGPNNDDIVTVGCPAHVTHAAISSTCSRRHGRLHLLRVIDDDGNAHRKQSRIQQRRWRWRWRWWQDLCE